MRDEGRLYIYGGDFNGCEEILGCCTWIDVWMCRMSREILMKVSFF